MKIQRADDGISVVFNTASDDASADDTEMRSIISAKEARKLLGKELSDTIDDIDLMGVVGLMSHLAEGLLSTVNVPQNDMASV